jgi:hypothetical protein
MTGGPDSPRTVLLPKRGAGIDPEVHERAAAGPGWWTNCGDPGGGAGSRQRGRRWTVSTQNCTSRRASLDRPACALRGCSWTRRRGRTGGWMSRFGGRGRIG